MYLSVANCTLLVFLLSAVHQPTEATFEQVTFNKIFLYHHLLAYRDKYMKYSGVGGTYFVGDTTKSPAAFNLSKGLGNGLPPFPGMDLVDLASLAPERQIEKIDLPLLAYRIFSSLCRGDNATFEWGVRDGRGQVPRYIRNGWTGRNIPQGVLVPMCMCNGQPAVHRTITYLANFEPFVPLLDNGFSHLSAIVMESCIAQRNIELFWPIGCSDCKLEMTKACVVVSKTYDKANVMCNCFHGFDSVSRCRNIIDKCTSRVQLQSTETGRDLCQVDMGNKCITDGDSYMCICYMPYFENKTMSNFPNCLGKRGKGDSRGLALLKCDSVFCGNGICVGNSNEVKCLCDQGYEGPTCERPSAVMSEWSDWSDCFPPCGNIGDQMRQRDCQPADGDDRFCEGLRRQHRRCLPFRCFENDSFPVFIKSLRDPLPTNLYMWSSGIFAGTFIFVYCIGIIITLGINFQDWKLEAVNQAGKRAYIIDQVCDELMLRHSEIEASRQRERLNRQRRERAAADGVSIKSDIDIDEEEAGGAGEINEESELFAESEDFFRMGVFVPIPVVDHLTGVSRMNRRRIRQAKAAASKVSEMKEKVLKGTQPLSLDEIDYDKLFTPKKVEYDTDESEDTPVEGETFVNSEDTEAGEAAKAAEK